VATAAILIEFTEIPPGARREEAIDSSYGSFRQALKRQAGLSWDSHPRLRARKAGRTTLACRAHHNVLDSGRSRHGKRSQVQPSSNCLQGNGRAQRQLLRKDSAALGRHFDLHSG
jgi:hypothetical protein